MTRRRVIVAGVALLAIGCNPDSRRKFGLPTSPTETAPPPIFVQPQPRQFPPYEITTIAVGEVINLTNLDAPECIGFDRWPCLYFGLVAPSTGTLDVTLSYAWGTQGNQGVDVSLREVGTFREFWAQSFSSTGPRWQTVLIADVVEGKTYDVTLWYTMPNLEFELRSALRQRTP
jgi:hypothetical protein